VQSLSVVNASERATDTPASSQRFRGEPPILRMFIRKNKALQALTL